MKDFRFISIFFLLAFTCCNHTAQKAVQKVEVFEFIFDSSELRMLTVDACDKNVVLDSVGYISRFDSVKQNYFKNQFNLDKTICICFNFLGSSNFNLNKLSVQFMQRLIVSKAALIPSHSFLLVSIADSNSISLIKGNEFYFDGHMPSDSLNSCVMRLFLDKPNTGAYGQKFVNLVFPNDSLQFADTFLTQLIIGYIRAQRAICKVRYGKALKDASNQEIIELKKTNPLIFGIKCNKNAL